MADGKKTVNKNENVEPVYSDDAITETIVSDNDSNNNTPAVEGELMPTPTRIEQSSDNIGETNYEIMTDRKDGERRAEEVLGSKLGGVSFKPSDPETNHELPTRMLYQGRKLRLNKSRMWLLQSFGGFTVEELTEFQRKYSKELTIDETEVIGLYLRALSGDREAKLLLWDLNKEIFKATKQVYIEQMKAEVQSEQNKGQTRMESMLEQIGQKIQESNEKLSNKDK